MTFAEFLFQRNISPPLPKERWRELRAEFRKIYHKEYRKKYRGRTKRIEIVVHPGEYNQIAKAARGYDEKVSAFIRKAALAYLTTEVYLPFDADIEQIKFLIARIGNSLGEIVHNSHIERNISESQLLAAAKQLQVMEKTLDQFFKAPKAIFKPLNLANDAD